MKLKYKGVMNGFFRFSNGGGFPVTKGQIYDVPDQFTDKLIKVGSWERINEVEVKDKKFNKRSVKNKIMED